MTDAGTKRQAGVRAFRVRVTATTSGTMYLPASSAAVAKRKARKMLKDALDGGYLTHEDMEYSTEILSEGP